MNNPERGSGLFPDTRWSLISRIRGGDEREASVALGEVCRAYWYPLYIYARRFGLTEADAKDAVQELFLGLLKNGRLLAANPERGRLRNFLLSALKSVISHGAQAAIAAKRGGGAVILSLDVEAAEARYAQEAPVNVQEPDEAFDYGWACQVIEEARELLRREYEESGRKALYETLVPALLIKDQPGPLAPGTDGSARVALHRLRKRYGECLLKVVRVTVADEREAREELAHLLRAYARR